MANGERLRKPKQRRSEMTPEQLARARALDRAAETLRRARHPDRFKAYYAIHRDRLRTYKRDRRQGPIGDAIRAQGREVYRRRATDLIAYMKATGYKAQKKWKSRNPERLREYAQRRNAVKKATTVEKVDYRDILRKWDGSCGICREAVLVFDQVHFDHIRPLSKGGAHAASNIQVAHALCNLKKYNKVA